MNKIFSKIYNFLIIISAKIMLIENKLKNELKVEVNSFAKLKIRKLIVGSSFEFNFWTRLELSNSTLEIDSNQIDFFFFLNSIRFESSRILKFKFNSNWIRKWHHVSRLFKKILWRHDVISFFNLKFSFYKSIVSLFTALFLYIISLHYFFALFFCIIFVNRHSLIMSFSSSFSSRQFLSSNSVNDDKIILLFEFFSNISRVNQHDNQSFFVFDIFYVNKQQHLQKAVDVIARKYSTLHIEELTYICWTSFINMQFQQ